MVKRQNPIADAVEAELRRRFLGYTYQEKPNPHFAININGEIRRFSVPAKSKVEWRATKNAVSYLNKMIENWYEQDAKKNSVRNDDTSK